VTDERERNCGTCQHWEQDWEYIGRRPCNAILSENFEGDVPEDRPCVVLGDVGYGSLQTPRAFSCSLWEAKP